MRIWIHEDKINADPDPRAKCCRFLMIRFQKNEQSPFNFIVQFWISSSSLQIRTYYANFFIILTMHGQENLWKRFWQVVFFSCSQWRLAAGQTPSVRARLPASVSSVSTPAQWRRLAEKMRNARSAYTVVRPTKHSLPLTKLSNLSF